MTATLPPPPVLHPVVRRHAEQLRGAERGAELLDQLGVALVERVFACSEFVAHSCTRDPALLCDLVSSDDLRASYAPETIAQRVAAALAGVSNEIALARQLRLLRRREMVRIAWRDLAGWADLAETMRDLTALADACIDGALRRLTDFNAPIWGTPSNARGEAQQLVVIAMGKLGAGELNFSSDVDLMFAFPEEGETRGGAHATSNGEYFTRLGRQLIQTLNQNTADGFVFRVDMRLRPFGESGALALDFDAMEQYYQVHGREWERYALIKARACAGDHTAGERLLATLRPFVYRRYLDFSAFESLREMKEMIAQEIKRKNLEHNVKLGAGGIREIEFIGQAFQLIRGGRQPALQERRIQLVLERLREARYLPDYVVDELQQAYVFLRTSEHRLQEHADQQTHNLPSDATERARLAYGMNFPDWAAYETALRKHRLRVHNHFEQVFAAPQTETQTGSADELATLWSGGLSDEHALRVLHSIGFRDAAAAQTTLAHLRQSAAVRALSPAGSRRLAQLIPLILGAVGAGANAEETLERILRLVEAVARRTTYLSLLAENPMALSQLVRLCAASPWIADLLRRHPILLDELLDPRTLYAPPGAEALRGELAQRLAAVTRGDLEQQMETLRQFKQANVLRVAAADIADALPLMQVSDHLSWIADAVVAATLKLAWDEMVARHGAPACRIGDHVCAQGFAVVAYGKLGGLELGYGSDLDLVFLYATASDDELTPGPKPIASALFFARLGQRVIHILTAHTPSGVLYDVDMRLRPSGASGLLVTHIDAFAEYQRTDAWTWEHQALARARPIAGDDVVLQRFDGVRREILSRRRDLDALRREVRDMREKMRATQDTSGADAFDLKQGAGGIVDIEFIVQFGVLGWAHAHSDLLTYPDNIRQLEALARAQVLSPDEAHQLSDAYRTYRARQHKLTLRGVPATVDDAEYRDQRAAVRAVWERLLGSAPG
jgi:glutamate-ammonia-ligase adenylyltransferase